MGLINSALEKRLQDMEDKIALLEEALAPAPEVETVEEEPVEEESDGD